MAEGQMTVKVLQTGIGGTGAPMECTAALDTTVGELKEIVKGLSGIDAADQRLIYSGKVLKDAMTLGSYGYKEGNVIHLVKSQKPQQTAATPTQSPAQAPTRSQPPGLDGFGGLGAMGGGNGMQAAEQMMQDPAAMERLMNNPMMQGLLDQPELVREMMMQNPQVRAIMESNPEVGAMLTNPEHIRQSLAMARNPALRAEMMRTHDRQMSNLEAIPGGFNRLRQMHQEIQEPLYEAVGAGRTVEQPGREQTRSTQQSEARQSPESSRSDNPFIALLQPPNSALQQPNTAAAPNPWASAPSAAAPAANPFQSLFGQSGGAGPAQQPAAGIGAGLPGFGGIGMPGMTPGVPPSDAQLQQVEGLIGMMEQNPAMRGMMESMMSNPAVLEQAAAQGQLSPEMVTMMRDVMSNPDRRRQMLDPANMRAALQLQRAYGSMRSGAGQQAPAGSADPPAPGANLTAGANPFAGLFGGAAPQPPAAPSAADYTSQLQQMRDMGFYDEAANLQALNATGGNVSAAVERVLSQMGGM